MTKKTEGPNQMNLLELLPPERRQEIIAEALESHIQELVLSNANSTLGDFIKTVVQHDYWDQLKDLRVGQILSPRGREAERGGGGRERSARITPADVQKVKGYIEKNPGQSAGQIQKGLTNIDGSIVSRALAKLRAEKQVKTQGEKRSMTYSA
jgi:hypothetical protein